MPSTLTVDQLEPYPLPIRVPKEAKRDIIDAILEGIHEPLSVAKRGDGKYVVMRNNFYFIVATEHGVKEFKCNILDLDFPYRDEDIRIKNFLYADKELTLEKKTVPMLQRYALAKEHLIVERERAKARRNSKLKQYLSVSADAGSNPERGEEEKGTAKFLACKKADISDKTFKQLAVIELTDIGKLTLLSEEFSWSIPRVLAEIGLTPNLKKIDDETTRTKKAKTEAKANVIPPMPDLTRDVTPKKLIAYMESLVDNFAAIYLQVSELKKTLTAEEYMRLSEMSGSQDTLEQMRLTTLDTEKAIADFVSDVLIYRNRQRLHRLEERRASRSINATGKGSAA